MIRPTPRAIAVAGAGFVPALLPALVDGTSAFLWPIGLLLLVAAGLYDYWTAGGGGRVDVTVHVPTPLGLGRERLVTVDVDCGPRVSLRHLVIESEHDDALGPARSVTTSTDAEGRVRSTLVLMPSRRGKFRFRAVWCRWRGRLGLLERRVSPRIDDEVLVVPDLPESLTEAARIIEPFLLSLGRSRQSLVGQGSEFDRLREYQPGYDARSIDWKASARHAKLLVREFRYETNHQLVLALDAGRLMGDPLEGQERLDHAIRSALVLAYAAFKAGDQVSLAAFASRLHVFRRPRRGVSALRELRVSLGEIASTTEETNFTLSLAELSARIDRRSLVVVLTEFSDALSGELMVEAIERIAARHLVLFVTFVDVDLNEPIDVMPRTIDDIHRAVVVDGLLRERALTLARLARAGVLHLEARPKDLTGRLVSRYLEILRRERI